MKKKLCISLLILVGALVLAGPALATEPKAVEAQTKEPVAGAPKAEVPKAIEAQTKEPVATPAPAAAPKAPVAGAAPAPEGKTPEGQTKPSAAVAAKGYNGKVVDAKTKAPVEGALVTLGDPQVRRRQGRRLPPGGQRGDPEAALPGLRPAGARHLGTDGAQCRDRPDPLQGQGALSHRLRAGQQENPGSGPGSRQSE